MNKIIIENLELFAYHGVHENEKLNGQNFFISAEIFTEKTKGYDTDEILDTVSYSEIIKAIKKIFLSHKFNLLEKACESVCKELFLSFYDIVSVIITVKKPEAPINEKFDYVAVSVKRSRSDFCEVKRI